jgi:hypothetical protein
MIVNALPDMNGEVIDGRHRSCHKNKRVHFQNFKMLNAYNKIYFLEEPDEYRILLLRFTP